MDGATTMQVTTVTLGEKWMGLLLAGKPLVMTFPPGPNPTHQFTFTIDEDTRIALTGGVTNVEKEPENSQPLPDTRFKDRKLKSR